MKRRRKVREAAMQFPRALMRAARLLPQAVTLSIYGFHFRKVFEKRLG